MPDLPVAPSRSEKEKQENVQPRDFYRILGVARTASRAEIGDAFRRIAAQYHPDRNKSHEAEEMMKEASEVYAVLSDDEKRALYDALGPEKYDDPWELYLYRMQREAAERDAKTWEAYEWERRGEAVNTIIGSIFFLVVLDTLIPSYVLGPWDYVFNGFVILCLIVGIHQLVED
jgi:hypothetical protein